MNTVNQTFNWSRFILTLRKEIVENWRVIALIGLSIYLWYSVSMVINSIMNLNGHFDINPFMFALFAVITASLAFRKLTTKNGRVDLFTSPSSSVEKFITNILIFFVGTFIIFILGFQLADVTRYFVMSFLNAKLHIESVAPTNLIDYFKVDLDDISQAERAMIQSMVFELIFAGTVFFLGSVLWPRRSILKTAAVVLAICLVKILVLAVWGHYAIGDNSTNDELLEQFMGNAFRANLYFDIAFFAFCWGLAWYLFKRKDVISLKWWK